MRVPILKLFFNFSKEFMLKTVVTKLTILSFQNKDLPKDYSCHICEVQPTNLWIIKMNMISYDHL